jgi:hypothetical protein
MTFTLSASGDDGDVGAEAPASGGYPPAAAAEASSDGTAFTVGRRNAFGWYGIFNGLVRFDTSSLPDNATVTGATLKLFVNLKVDGDNRNLVGEWYPGSNWPIDASDYTATASATALAGADITAISTNAVNSFGLQNLKSLSLTGYTGLRLHVDGGAPAADNLVQLASFESPSPKPQLVVTYTVP